jgi:hypothetical protein
MLEECGRGEGAPSGQVSQPLNQGPPFLLPRPSIGQTLCASDEEARGTAHQDRPREDRRLLSSKPKAFMGLFDFLKPKKPIKRELPPEVAESFQKLTQIAFPGGPEQIEREADQLHALLQGKLGAAEAKHLLTKIKLFLLIWEDKSRENITREILEATQRKLSPAEASSAYQFLSGMPDDLYSGGEGTSKDDAVIINSANTTDGIHAEYKWLERRFGKKGIHWTTESRSHGSLDDGRSFEIFSIKLRDGTMHDVEFDITSFYKRS